MSHTVHQIHENSRLLQHRDVPSHIKRVAKDAKHRTERQSWRQMAREFILEIADGSEFTRARRHYEGWLS